MNPDKEIRRNGRKIQALLLLLLSIMLVGCSQSKPMDKAHAKTEKLFQKALNKADVHNGFLAVYSPSLGIDWNFVGGKFEDGTSVSSDHPFYTASIGKMFTAVAIAMLAENGKLSFDDRIANHLPDSIMNRLHVLNGVDYSRQIKISHLLQHTAGLPDYFESPTITDSPNVMALIFEQPDRLWEPWETIRFTKENMQPTFAPGKGYLYTDTDYILLGLIVERISEKVLSDFFRESIFVPLEMKNTFMNVRSEPIAPTAAMAEIYIGDQEVSHYRSLSADWAGGGLISTTEDLIKFQYGLNEGKLVTDSILKSMQNWTPEMPGMEYGFGLRKISLRKLFPLLPKLTLIGHSGSNASFAYYCPEIDVYLAGTLNQSKQVKQSVMLPAKILAAINREI